MKQIVLCLLAFFISNSVFSQRNEWEWNEHTKDVAYEAPISKFTKKWYSRNNDGYYDILIMRPNGTCTFEGTTNNDETGFVIPIKLTFSATWKRIERLTFLVTYTNMKSTVDQSVLAKIPARRRDIFKKSFAQYEVSQKKKIVGRKEKHSILKVDDDHLIMLCGGRYYYYMSERLYKRKLDENALAEKEKIREEKERQAAETKRVEEERRRAEEARKAEEVRKAEDARRAEEARNAEVLRKAKEEAEKDRKAEQYALENHDYLQKLSPEKQESVINAYKMGYELVDLGLSVRWANMNIGAKRPADRGYLFSWGEIEPTEGYEDKNYQPIVPNNVDFLDDNSDPATLTLGKGFHTPTIEQWKELKKKCKRKVSDVNKCVIFIGPNGNSITLPFFTYSSNKRYDGWHVLDYGTGKSFATPFSCMPVRPVME
jgi:hypothetical protein